MQLNLPKQTQLEAEMERKVAPPATAISAVLDDDDLLIEILVRVAFPTSLVRAALVCKRWYGHASAPAFLRRFRGLHPPRLLGFYVVTLRDKTPRFVPLPQPPELAAVVRRGSFDLDTLGGDRVKVAYWNGLYMSIFEVLDFRPVRMARFPLYPWRYSTRSLTLPTVPYSNHHDRLAYKDHGHFTYHDGELLPSGCSGADGVSYYYLAIGSKKQQTVLDAYALQDGLWVICASALIEISDIHLKLPSLLDGTKIYNVASVDGSYKLAVLDLVSSSLSLFDLPEEVEIMSTELSLAVAGGSGIHLTHIQDSQLRIWHHSMDNNGVPNWFLVDTICLHEICVNHMIPTCMLKSNRKLHAVGVESGFLLLEMDKVLYLFDIKRKDAKKVYEVTKEDIFLFNVIPLMMVWPPEFPVMKEICHPKE